MKPIASTAVLFALLQPTALGAAEPTPEKIQSYIKQSEAATSQRITSLESRIQILAGQRGDGDHEQQIQEMKAELTRLKDGAKFLTPRLAVPPKVGDIGFLDKTAHVIEVLDVRKMLVELRWSITARDSSGAQPESRSSTRAPTRSRKRAVELSRYAAELEA